MAVDLERLVDEFVELTADFSDLDFRAPYGRLDMKTWIPDVNCLRIELQWPLGTELQLASVLLSANGLDDPVADTIRRASSTWDEGFAAMLENGDLFEQRRSTAAVRTKSEVRPWLEIEFTAPVDLKRVRLRNVGGQGAWGSNTWTRGIQILVRTSDGWWSTIYDGWEREREFQHRVELKFGGRLATRAIETKVRRRLGRERTAGPHYVEGDLVRIVAGIYIGIYNNLQIFRDLQRLELSHEEIARFQQLITDKLLRRRRMEFNPHGIRRTFRFWSKDEKVQYLQFAVDVVGYLRELNDNVCLGFGSVLSIVRDRKLIPHDDDLDIIIGFEPKQASSITDGLQLVRRCLRRNGLKVSANYMGHLWAYPPWGGPKVDVFVSIFEGDSIAWYPSRRGTLTRDIVFPAAQRSLMGIQRPVPRRPKAYLEKVYGPGWVSPDPSHQHPKMANEWIDIR